MRPLLLQPPTAARRPARAALPLGCCRRRRRCRKNRYQLVHKKAWSENEDTSYYYLRINSGGGEQDRYVSTCFGCPALVLIRLHRSYPAPLPCELQPAAAKKTAPSPRDGRRCHNSQSTGMNIAGPKTSAMRQAAVLGDCAGGRGQVRPAASAWILSSLIMLSAVRRTIARTACARARGTRGRMSQRRSSLVSRLAARSSLCVVSAGARAPPAA